MYQAITDAITAEIKQKTATLCDIFVNRYCALDLIDMMQSAGVEVKHFSRNPIGASRITIESRQLDRCLDQLRTYFTI